MELGVDLRLAQGSTPYSSCQNILFSNTNLNVVGVTTTANFDWHNHSFLLFLFFQYGTQFCTTSTRIGNIVNITGNRLLSKSNIWHIQCVRIISHVVFDYTVF